MQLIVLPGSLAVCRLQPDQNIPAWASAGRNTSLLSITYTAQELSLVCIEAIVPADVQCERGWRALKVQGPLDFALVGILSTLVTPLAEHGIAIFALSTYDTDYLLIKETSFECACAVLRQQGHDVRP